MKESSLFLRSFNSYEHNDPLPLINGEFVVDSSGKSKFVAKDPVSPSLASDFSVVNLALTSRFDVPVRSRISTDAVDVPEQFPELFND